MSIMRKLYNSRIFWLIIALIASLSLWIYVINQDTEEYKQTFPGVKVELVGEDILLNSRNMVITDLSTNTVTVEISGPRRIVGSWSADDLKAQVDVSKLTQSAFTSLQYTIKFPDGIDTSGVRPDKENRTGRRQLRGKRGRGLYGRNAGIRTVDRYGLRA